MRFREIIFEANLTLSQLVKHRGRYLLNLIKKIESGEAFAVSGKYQAKYGSSVILDKESAVSLKNYFFPKGNPDLVIISASGNVVIPDNTKKILLKLASTGEIIPFGALEKTSDIKGKEADYNLGDIGEIAIAVAVYSRFLKVGGEVSLEDFFSSLRQITVSYNKSGNSGQASAGSTIKYKTGKEDILSLKAVLPRRSMDFINTEEFLSGNIAQPDIVSTIKSAITFANKNQKVSSGIDLVSKNPETNKINVTCDGISTQKGTKADIIMDIDGDPINIVSAKVGRSQLGQASGHVFDKQITFFKNVFGVDVSKYEKNWGTTLEDHDRTLQAIWNEITPKISAAFSGDVTRKELPMVKQLANGLIKYSNTSKPGDVDIVKLISSPGRPGYKLLRVDEKLYEALEKIDLVAHPGSKGISIYGKYEGKKILLMKARSYLSQEAKTVRTIIEGGDLLDIVAEVIEP